MKLEKAVELLQGHKFFAEETFWWLIGYDVTSKYTVKVVDPKTLLDDIGIDLDNVTDEEDLFKEVETGLFHIQKFNSAGVKRSKLKIMD